MIDNKTNAPLISLYDVMIVVSRTIVCCMHTVSDFVAVTNNLPSTK